MQVRITRHGEQLLVDDGMRLRARASLGDFGAECPVSGGPAQKQPGRNPPFRPWQGAHGNVCFEAAAKPLRAAVMGA